MTNNLSKRIAWVFTAILAGFGTHILTRENSTIRVEPAFTLNMTNGKSVFINKAIIWGDRTKLFSDDSLSKVWKLKTRKTPLALMLANAHCEGGNDACIMRYEWGRHEEEVSWKRYSEFEATSGGLFQIMGFNYTKSPVLAKYGIKTWDTLCQNVTLQMDCYDDFMRVCMLWAGQADNGKDLIYRTIAAYGGNPYSINALTEKKYFWYKHYKNLYEKPSISAHVCNANRLQRRKIHPTDGLPNAHASLFAAPGYDDNLRGHNNIRYSGAHDNDYRNPPRYGGTNNFSGQNKNRVQNHKRHDYFTQNSLPGQPNNNPTEPKNYPRNQTRFFCETRRFLGKKRYVILWFSDCYFNKRLFYSQTYFPKNIKYV